MKLSHDQIRNLLSEAIRPTDPEDYSCWVKEVYDDEFIYRKSKKMFKAPYRIEEGKAVIGTSVEVVEETKYVTIFSDERVFTAFKESLDETTVIRKGKIFEGGDFPDKNVAFDEADLEAAVTNFAPVPNDLEHRESILDGKLGKLAKVWKSGKELFGEVHIPKWLDNAIGESEIKVSLAFDREKRIVGNALVLRPRIEDAAIITAFSLSEGSEPGDKKMKRTLKDWIKTTFGLDEVTDLNQEVEPIAAPTPTPEEKPKEEAEAKKPEADSEAEFSKATDARLKVVEAQLLKERAFAFADKVIREKKALPAQRDSIAAMYSGAVRSDAGEGSLFSAETSDLVSGSNVASVEKFFSESPTHALSGEAIPAGNEVLLFGSRGGDGPSSERVNELLDKTPLGRSAKEGVKK